MRFFYPTLRKEMLLRIRGGKSFLFFSFYVLALAATCVGAYALAVRGETATVGVGWRFGRQVFGIVLYAQAALSLLAAPGLLAGAIGAEVDEGTFPLLLLSPARPLEVLLGKLLPGLAFLGLMVVGTLPLAGTCLAFGGVTRADVFGAYLGLFAVMIAHGMIGLYASTLFLRTAPASVAAYGTVALFLAVSLAEPGLLGSDLYITARACVLWIVVILCAVGVGRPFAHAVLQGLSHLGCGCLYFLVIAAVNLGLWRVFSTQAPLLVALNPFAASLPFSDTGSWPGLPPGLDRGDAVGTIVVHLLLAALLLVGAWLRVRALMLRRARSDPLHVGQPDAPGT